MKLCKDCKHYRAADQKCTHESAIKVDPVSGERGFFYAISQRMAFAAATDCGHDQARFFEAAP